jgi:drug/metabolite transporter (DMT)-like permease
MSWLFYAIAARFFWAHSNLIDQYMVRFAARRSALVVIMAEYLILLPTIIILACIVGVPRSLKPASLVWIGAGAVINVVALFPYFLALRDDEAHSAIPLMELTPVILTFLAWLIFGDTLGRVQLLGAALVIASGFLFTWDFEHGRFKLRTIMLMAASSLCFAIYQLALRYGAQNESIWNVLLIAWTGYFLSAVVLFIALPAQRRLLVESVRESRGKILIIALGEETFSCAATLCLVAAFAIAPRAGQVAALSATQPIFVMLISVFLGLFLPRYYQRLVWSKELKIKCLLLLAIAAGIALLKSNSG